MSECYRQLGEQCKKIRDVIEELCNDKDVRYDTETGKVVSEYDSEDKRYQDLHGYLIDDNLGINVTTDIRGEMMYSCEICLAYGGPNIYVDTEKECVSGYWGSDRIDEVLSRHTCTLIDECVDKERMRLSGDW